MHSLVEGTFYTQNAEVLADAPYDVFSQVEASESDRHKGFYRKNTTPQECYLEQVEQYYGWAACFPNDCRATGDWRARCTSCVRDFETYQSVHSQYGYDLLRANGAAVAG